MTPTLGQPTLVHGDSLDVLTDLEPASIDAIVHDPPAGIGFMGREWDDKRGYKPRTDRGRQVLGALGLLGMEPWASGFVSFMTEVFVAELRVAKPGAHSLTWALPRTADLTVLALRISGWEVRDIAVHLFGGGFPKSHDVSKAIDKMHGAKREVVGKHPRPGSTRARTGMGDGWQAEPDITAPATDDAKRWDGWGTALSPGHEQWIIARAPLVGTVARNVLEHGTGAINVDGCRTPVSDSDPVNAAVWHTSGAYARFASDDQQAQRSMAPPAAGRWPKNALLSCSLACDGDRHTPWCPVGELDRQSGRLVNGGQKRSSDRPGASLAMEGGVLDELPTAFAGDAGGASRFFPRFGYHPKASDRTIAGRPDLTNKHPTHKSPELMRWLIRLITPPGGVVLDDFMGSGTTGVAAVAEGCRFIGIEREREHFDAARARILAAVGSPDYAVEANAVAPIGAQLGLL